MYQSRRRPTAASHAIVIRAYNAPQTLATFIEGAPEKKRRR